MKRLILIVFTVAIFSSNALGQTSRPLWVVLNAKPTEAILSAEQQPNFFTNAGWVSTGVYLRVNDVSSNPAVSTDFQLPNAIWAEYVQYSTSGIPYRYGYIIYSRDGEVVGSLWPEFRPLTYYLTGGGK